MSIFLVGNRYIANAEATVIVEANNSKEAIYKAEEVFKINNVDDYQEDFYIYDSDTWTVQEIKLPYICEMVIETEQLHEVKK